MARKDFIRKLQDVDWSLFKANFNQTEEPDSDPLAFHFNILCPDVGQVHYIISDSALMTGFSSGDFVCYRDIVVGEYEIPDGYLGVNEDEVLGICCGAGAASAIGVHPFGIFETVNVTKRIMIADFWQLFLNKGPSDELIIKT